MLRVLWWLLVGGVTALGGIVVAGRLLEALQQLEQHAPDDRA